MNRRNDITRRTTPGSHKKRLPRGLAYEAVEKISDRVSRLTYQDLASIVHDRSNPVSGQMHLIMATGTRNGRPCMSDVWRVATIGPIKKSALALLLFYDEPDGLFLKAGIREKAQAINREEVHHVRRILGRTGKG